MAAVWDSTGLWVGSRLSRWPVQLAQSANTPGFSPTSAEAGFPAGEALMEFEVGRQGPNMVARTQEDPPGGRLARRKGQRQEGLWRKPALLPSLRSPCTPLGVPQPVALACVMRVFLFLPYPRASRPLALLLVQPLIAEQSGLPANPLLPNPGVSFPLRLQNKVNRGHF